jgi:hypothetical protein
MSRETRGARVALVIEDCRDTERLLLAGGDAVTTCSSVTVIAVAARPLMSMWAPLSGMTTPMRIDRAALDEAARVARQAVDALPSTVSARHTACGTWSSVPFLAALREGAFDIALFATWPWLWTHRRLVRRAARAGGTTVVRSSRPHDVHADSGLGVKSIKEKRDEDQGQLRPLRWSWAMHDRGAGGLRPRGRR